MVAEEDSRIALHRHRPYDDFNGRSDNPIQAETDGQTTTVRTRFLVNGQLTAVTDASHGLSAREFDALIAGPKAFGVAPDRERRGVNYAGSAFGVALPAAIEVLEQWVVATACAHAIAERRDEQTTLELAATPAPVPQSRAEARMDRTDLELRHLAVEADDNVRIAAPYLDPNETVLEDFAALPAQGVVAHLLTPQAAGPDADPDQRKAVEMLAPKVGGEARDALAVRALYETTPAGYQREALHPKTIIVDDEPAYTSSANFTSTGQDSNFELGMLLGGLLVDDVVTMFDAMFERADPVHFEQRNPQFTVLRQAVPAERVLDCVNSAPTLIVSPVQTRGSPTASTRTVSSNGRTHGHSPTNCSTSPVGARYTGPPGSPSRSRSSTSATTTQSNTPPSAAWRQSSRSPFGVTHHRNPGRNPRPRRRPRGCESTL